MQSGSFSNLTEISWLQTYSQSIVKNRWKLIKLDSGQKSVTNWQTYWLTKQKQNMHDFLTTRAICLIIKLGPDILATYIFTKFSEARMKTDSVRERTKKVWQTDGLTDGLTDWRTDG